MSELRNYVSEEEYKRKFLIEELTSMNVKRTQRGNELKKASYDELKEELVLQSFRVIDVECDSAKWF